MLEDNENVVVEATENVVEQATEELVDSTVVETEQEPEKVYTEEDFNKKVDELLAKKIARKEAKIRKEYEQKYAPLTNVLSAGLGTDNVEEMTTKMSDFYKENGVEIPTKQNYSEQEEEILARAEANFIIEAGFDEVIEETDRLTKKGLANMNAREKTMFETLATYRKQQEDMTELKKIGADDLVNSAEFKEFREMFNKSTPINKVYEMYEKTKIKKEVEPIGSVKNTAVKDDVKEFYTYEEASKFTKADFDKNPKLFDRVVKSMQSWSAK